MVSPRQRVRAKLPRDVLRQLGAESKGVNDVGEVVLDIVRARLPVVLEVVNMVVAVAEASTGGKVEVSYNLVDPESAFDAAAFRLLFHQLLGIVLALTLLDVLPATKGPASPSVRLPDLLASVAAALLLRIGRRVGTVAPATVVGVEMGSYLILVTTAVKVVSPCSAQVA